MNFPRKFLDGNHLYYVFCGNAGVWEFTIYEVRFTIFYGINYFAVKREFVGTS
jgi:hypothetical protein